MQDSSTGNIGKQKATQERPVLIQVLGQVWFLATAVLTEVGKLNGSIR